MTWDSHDFAVAFALVTATLGAIFLAWTLIASRKVRAAAILAILMGLALVWAELAVGLIG